MVQKRSQKKSTAPERKPLPSADTIRAALSFDPETGVFTWRSPRQSNLRGKPAGNITLKGYRRIHINGDHYTAHRLAWVYMTGQEPPESIDHINGDRSDNRWSNLRAATQSQNVANCRVHADKKIPLKGFSKVSWNADRYFASIMVKGKKRHLGTFGTPEEAHAAYVAAAVALNGEFANSGERPAFCEPCLNKNDSEGSHG